MTAPTPAAVTRWHGAEGREVDAARLTPGNLDELWQWVESKPHYDTDRNVDGLAVYADHGREVALFGDWVARNVDDGLPWTTSDADFRARFSPATAPAEPQPATEAATGEPTPGPVHGGES